MFVATHMVRRLTEQGWIEPRAPAAGAEATPREAPPPLTPEQAAALQQLAAAPPGYSATLLEGVGRAGQEGSR